MKLKNIFFLFLIFLIGTVSCKKTNSAEGDKIEKVSVAEAKMVKFFPGKNRIKVSVLLNPDDDIAKVAVFWNSLSDSIVVPINKVNKLDTIHAFIGNLEEKEYDFSFFTYNSKGNRSDKMLMRERVYGDLYEGKLVNKGIDHAILEADGNVVIDWRSLSEAIGVELAYMDERDLNHKVIVSKNEFKTVLKRYKRNSTFEYRTLFQPKANVIDTFYSVTKKDNAVEYEPALVGTIPERILVNSNLVKTMVSSTTSSTYAGLEESYVKFIDKNNNPQSLFILQVDLNNDKLKLEAGTPSDGTVYGSNQTVSDMIKWKNQNSKGKRVIAAVNADYYTIATGIPLGPTVKNGVELKTLSGDYCFVGALDNNLCIVGQGESVYNRNLSRMKEALGAFQPLVLDGEVQKQTDLSRAPRTTSGVIGTSKLIFIVVDGRQPDYSFGLSLGEMGLLHKAIGVKNAVNLDGGGSTTFIVKDALDKYIVKNKVSDGYPRRVANSWLILESKE